MSIELDHVTNQVTVDDAATNSQLVIASRGTGAVDIAAGSSGVNISNGGTVTAITFTSGGSGYTSNPIITISAPTTAGGVQATTGTRMGLWSNAIASGGTGYTVGDVLTYVGGTLFLGGAVQLQVTTVSAGVITGTVVYNNQYGNYSTVPTNPISVTGGTGTGATFTATWTVYGITTLVSGSGYVEQPTVSFSGGGGGGSGAAAYATVGSGTVVRSLGSAMDFYMPSGVNFRVGDAGATSTYYWQAIGGAFNGILRGGGSTQNALIQTGGTGGISLQTNNGAQTQALIAHTASAVNYLQVTGSATASGSGPTVSTQGSDTNVNLTLQTKGTGYLNLLTNRTNYFQMYGANTGFGPTLYSWGSDTNVDLSLTTKGTGGINFSTGATSAIQARVIDQAGATRYVEISGGVAGATAPGIGTGNGNEAFDVYARSNSIRFSTNGKAGNIQAMVASSSSTVNYLQFVGSATAASPSISVQGSDTNINLNLVPKGTGNVQQNGTNLALSTHKYHAFTVGTYYFDTYEQSNFFRLFPQNATTDTIRYKTVTSPEYYDYGTSTWTAWAAGLSGIQQLLDGNPSTGIDVAHANRTFRFIVSGVDGWPTNALVMLQTTWSAISYTTATVTIATSTVIGGPFTSRQVMVFSGANSGNNWGLHSYYTGSIHTGDTFYQITIDLTDWVDVSTYTTYPLRNLNIFSNYSTAGGIFPYTTTYGKNASFIGGITTGTDVNGGLGIGRYSSTDTNTYLDAIGSTSGMFQRVNYWPSIRLIAPTNSVNYVEFSGATTGNTPSISVQGSDSNANISLNAKGTGSVVVNAPVKLQGYTVATLPAAGTIGRTAYVTDATAPTYLGTLTGGGTVKTPVFDNGTAWVSY